jgi:phage pi2 protein 07
MNQTLERNYITLNQAKLLKEKGFESIKIDYGLNQMLNNSNPPEQWQVVEWLRVNHGIWVYVDTHEFGKWCFNYKKIEPTEEYPNINVNGAFSVEDFNSPQEAYSEAFDYVLNNLI